SPVIPPKAVFEHQQWDVAGFDSMTGDVILRQKGRAPDSEYDFVPLENEAALADYPEISVGNGTVRRDAAGNIYDLVEVGGVKHLLQDPQFRVAPTRDVFFRAPEAAEPQPAVSMRRQRAVHEGREWEVEGYDAHSGDAVLRDLADVDRLAETVQIRQLKAANL